MPRALKPCSTPGCPEPVTSGRCDRHRREADRARGTAHQRGYGTRHRNTFRAAVLARDTHCQWPDCTEPATEADHWPLSRRELVDRHLDPDDPQHGRGLCSDHHKQATATNQPGGWHATQQP